MWYVNQLRGKFGEKAEYYSAIDKNYQALKKDGDILKVYYQVKMIFSLISII